MLGIVNYGAGNLGSIGKAFDYLYTDYRFVSEPKDLVKCSGLVLPGVGAFGAAVDKLETSGFITALKEYIASGSPVLGICLGMQLLLKSSEESDGVEGLSVFDGFCRKFTSGKVPQIGWNDVRYPQNGSRLFADIDEGSLFYFVHSYYAEMNGRTEEAGISSYSVDYVSAYEYGNVSGVQFHPEKSGETGIKLLKNWVKYYLNGEER